MDSQIINMILKGHGINAASLISMAVGAYIMYRLIYWAKSWLKDTVPSKSDLSILVERTESALLNTNTAINELKNAIQTLSVAVLENSKKTSYLEGMLKR